MPLQTHIRSPLLSATPISRLRRARAQEGGTIFFAAFEARPDRGPRSAHLDPPELIKLWKIDEDRFNWFSDGCLSALQYYSGGNIFPEGNEQLPCQGDDEHLSDTTAIELNALVEPLGQP